MNRIDFIALGVMMMLFVVAFFVIRGLKLGLPLPTSTSDFVNRLLFFKYPDSIDRSLITHNRIAWFTAAIVIYLFMITVYRWAT